MSSAAVSVCIVLLLATVGCARGEQPTVEEEPFGRATSEPTPTATASQTAPATADEITVQMQAQSDSGETGTATLTRVDATKTKVTLQLENPPAGPQPAHIHTGNCPKPGGVKYPLTNVENGTSETTVAASLDDLLAGAFAINVHKSPGDAHVYVSCGDIRR
ncbi:MAG: CHRD domain-containing protein [Actinomycetota bacterium]